MQRYPTLADLEGAIRKEFVLGGHKTWAVALIAAGDAMVLLSSPEPATVSAWASCPRPALRRLSRPPSGSCREAMVQLRGWC